jgi:hypothetical protein
MIDPRVEALCKEFGITIVPANRYPGVSETRAEGAIAKIIANFGEGHARLVLSTLSETTNNKACIDRDTLWCISHLIRAYPKLLDREATKWLECFDAIPLGELAHVNNKTLRGKVKLPHSLAGMVNERIYRWFGPDALEPDLFDVWRVTK